MLFPCVTLCWRSLSAAFAGGCSRNNFMRWLEHLPWRALGRWWIVGLGFYGVGLGVLYLFTSVLKMPLMIGTLLSAEITLVLRFFVNDRWVFQYRRPSWVRLW